MTAPGPVPCPSADPLGDFIRDAGSLSGADAAAIDRLCDRIGVPRDPARWRSTLNNDGSPLQICLSLRPGAGGPDLRVIVDPYEAPGDTRSRVVQSHRTLARLAEWHAADMGSLCQSVLARMTPSGCDIPYIRDGGDAWFAARLGGRGAAVYATARWGDPASRWRRALAWLCAVSPGAGRSIALIEVLASHATLVSVGVEGGAAGDARAKFYWRPNGSAPLSRLGVRLLASQALAAFLADATEGTATPASAIVGSVGVSIATGSITDVKLDLCGHCVPRGWGDWARRIDRYGRWHDMTALPFGALGPHAAVEIAFVGLGVDAHRRPRLNIYLKPLLPGGRR